MPAIELTRYAGEYPSLGFAEPAPHVLEIAIGRDAKLNAADAATHRDLSRVWRSASEDAAVRVILVRGAGAHFSAGGDFALIESMLDDESTLLRVFREASDLVYNMVNCTKPVVSAIRGTAVGAGLAVALLADVSVAARDARLLDGHTRLGVAAGDHAVMIWPLLCGLAKARYYLLTNRPLSGAEAERIGLVALCVEDDAVLATALGVCCELAAGSASAIGFTRHALNNWLRLAGPSFDASLALEFLGFRLSDLREGLAAVRGKRPPEFEGPTG